MWAFQRFLVSYLQAEWLPATDCRCWFSLSLVDSGARLWPRDFQWFERRGWRVLCHESAGFLATLRGRGWSEDHLQSPEWDAKRLSLRTLTSKWLPIKSPSSKSRATLLKVSTLLLAQGSSKWGTITLSDLCWSADWEHLLRPIPSLVRSSLDSQGEQRQFW